MNKRPRSSSLILSAPGSQKAVVRAVRGMYPIYGKSRSHRRTAKKRVPVLWLERTTARGLMFPQANTFPVPYFTELHFNKVDSLTVSAGTFVAEKQYRLSGPYDLEVAVGGNQPYYYDTLIGGNGTSAPYSAYRVIKTRVDVQFYNDNTSVNAALMVGATVGLNLNGVAATAAGAQLLMQRPETRIIPCPPQYAGGATPGLTMFVDHAKLLGVKDMKDADDQVGAYNGLPSGAEVGLILHSFPIDTGNTNTAEVWFRLHITYYVELRQRNTVTES